MPLAGVVRSTVMTTAAVLIDFAGKKNAGSCVPFAACSGAGTVRHAGQEGHSAAGSFDEARLAGQ